MISLKDIQDLDADTLLGVLGLRRADSVDWVRPVVGGLAVGLLTGTALGLLFAPKSGQELRKRVRRVLDDAKANAESALASSKGRQESATPSQV